MQASGETGSPLPATELSVDVIGSTTPWRSASLTGMRSGCGGSGGSTV
jgi:hypothetical protein